MSRFVLSTRPLLTLGFTLVPLFVSSGCGRSTAPAIVSDQAALTVTLVQPSIAVWAERVTVSGGVAAWQESIIGSEVNALKLDEVLVEVGDVVRRGQVLARFNDETTRAELAQVEASVAMAEASLALARDQADRAVRLKDTGTVSHEAIIQYESAIKTGSAQLASANAQLEAQKLRLLRTQVLAPDDGIISSRSATMGAVLSVGVELFRMIRQGRLEWRAEVPGSRLGQVVAGLEVDLRPVGYPTIQGRVRQISPRIDEGKGTGTVYVDLPTPGNLKAGAYASGEISFGESPALTVPESALVYRDGFTYVMSVDADHKVRQLKVTTGRRVGTSVEIVEGVTTGDQLVNSGGSFLNEGDTVRVVPAETIVQAAQTGDRS